MNGYTNVMLILIYEYIHILVNHYFLNKLKCHIVIGKIRLFIFFINVAFHEIDAKLVTKFHLKKQR